MPLSDLEKQQLTKLVGKSVKVFVTSGVAMSGRLVEFDGEILVLSGSTAAKPTNVRLTQVTSYYEQ